MNTSRNPRENGLKTRDIIELNPQQTEVYENTRTLYKNLIFDAFTENSKAKALKAKCIECVNSERKEITNCHLLGCPLWKHRPYQREEANKMLLDGYIMGYDEKYNDKWIKNE